MVLGKFFKHRYETVETPKVYPRLGFVEYREFTASCERNRDFYTFEFAARKAPVDFPVYIVSRAKPDFGQILANLRKERGLAQKELALLLNLSIGTISNYENGIHFPDLSTLCKLADFYGVTTDYLLGRTDYRFDPKTLNRRVTADYTVLDIVDTVLACEKTNRIENLMEYARFLSSQPD